MFSYKELLEGAKELFDGDRTKIIVMQDVKFEDIQIFVQSNRQFATTGLSTQQRFFAVIDMSVDAIALSSRDIGLTSRVVTDFAHMSVFACDIDCKTISLMNLSSRPHLTLGRDNSNRFLLYFWCNVSTKEPGENWLGHICLAAKDIEQILKRRQSLYLTHTR